MQVCVLFASMFFLCSSQVLAGNPIQFAIVNDAGEADFKAAVAAQGDEYEFNSAGENYLHTMALSRMPRRGCWFNSWT